MDILAKTFFCSAKTLNEKKIKFGYKENILLKKSKLFYRTPNFRFKWSKF